MTAVHDASATVVRFDRLYVSFTGLFVLKLAITPLFAYSTEPLPWSVLPTNFTTWDTHEAFTNATYAYFQQYHNFDSMDTDTVVHFDSASSTYIYRKRLVLPWTAVSNTSMSSYLIRFPGAMFYSSRSRQFVLTLLGQDSIERRKFDSLFECQRYYYYGFPSADGCIWMEPLPVESHDDDVYMVYFGTFVFESALWCWFKLSFRCLLMLYNLSVLCRRYCRSYRPLFQGQREIGLGNQYCRPTRRSCHGHRYDARSSLYRMVHRAGLHDLSAFFLGCFYSSRYVWCGYLAMRCTSYMARWRGWEAKFSPIDPGMLAIAAYLYGGPVMSLIGNTSMLLVFHDTWDIFLPAQLKGNNIDGAGGVLIGTAIVASLPVVYSFTYQHPAMAKVEPTSRVQASVRISRFSLFYTGLFVLKLASTPLIAYLSEPLPWLIPERSFVDYLRQLYNNQTMSPGTVCRFDSTTITYVVRNEIALSLERISPESFNSHFIHFPGAMFYGSGPNAFVRNFLNQDATERRAGQMFYCQRNRYYGTVVSDACIWLEPMALENSRDVYMVYFATFVWESAFWSWFKICARCCLTLFVLRVLWQRYCCHYLPLLHGLKALGVDNRCIHYEVIVGDPTYLILSDPRVSLAMTVDILLTPPYVCWSVLRVCQYEDLVAFSLGCFYSARFVWSGYFAMRCLSYVVKAQRWGSKFAPIDPGILGFGALLYGGPFMSFIGNTPLMAIFQITWTIFLPEALETQAIEVATGMVAGITIMGSFPIVLSLLFRRMKPLQPRLEGSLEKVSWKWSILRDYLRTHLMRQRDQNRAMTVVPEANAYRKEKTSTRRTEVGSSNMHSHVGM
ncbi:hypothetical protein AeMF1_010737 [Aphanomyces euteiches]|nr:hypothetical protein AeMF1_010737 [Aphanomyces euteiches]KAH9191556.1 hypothetical protein AeNC1_006476 [Aphanomyces euteiches]